MNITHTQSNKPMRFLWRLRCLMGWHEYWSYADQPDTMLLPKPGDTIEEIQWKFDETCALRCRYCAYQYRGSVHKSLLQTSAERKIG